MCILHTCQLLEIKNQDTFIIVLPPDPPNVLATPSEKKIKTD